MGGVTAAWLGKTRLEFPNVISCKGRWLEIAAIPRRFKTTADGKD